MTTQLSSLRVTADLDTSAYKAGADQKVAADNAMAASSRAVAASVSDTSTKISRSGDVLAQLSRQFVDGYGSAEKFDSAMRRLAAGVDTGKIAITQTGPILDGIYRKYGQTADASFYTARGQAELGLAITAANARFAAAKPVVEGHSNALGIGNTQMMALTHSARSFAEQMAMGIPVTQAMTSELNHLAFAAGGEDGLIAALKKVGPGLLASILTPMGAAITGFAALTVAATAYYFLTREESKTTEELLKEQKQAVDDLAKAYDLAKVSADNYNKSAGLFAEAAARKNQSQLIDAAREEDTGVLNQLTRFVTSGEQRGGRFGSVASGHLEARSQYAAFAGPIDAFARNFDYDALARGVHDITAQNPELQATGDKILNIAAAGAKAHDALKETADTLARINSRAPSLADSQLGLDYQDQNNANLYWLQRQHDVAMANIGAVSPDERRQAAIDAETAKPSPEGESAEVRQYKIDAAGALAYAQALNTLEVAQEENRRQLDQTVASAKANLDLVGKSTAEVEAQKMANQELAKVREDAARNGIDDEKQFQAIYGETIAKIKETSSEYGKLIALEQARQAIKTGQDDLEIQRAEVGLVGQNKLAHDAMIASLKTEQEIRKLGIPLYGDEANAMRANTASASANAEALARAQFQQNLLFERQQLFRNAEDQQIASALQGAGLPVDLNSQEAQMMRYNMALSETKDTFKGFFTDMASSLRQGKSLWEAFQNAAVNALSKIADKLIDRGLDGIFNSIFGGGQNGTSPAGSSLLGQLFNFGSSGGYSAQQQASTGSIVSSLFGASTRSVGSMQVQAAVVNVNGGIGGAGIPGLDAINAFLGGPNFKPNTTFADYIGLNDNKPSQDYIQSRIDQAFGTGGISQGYIQSRIDSAFGTLSNGLGGIFSPSGGYASALGGSSAAGMASGGGVAGQIWNFFAGKGLKDFQVAGILGNFGAESGLNPSAVNPSSGAFGIAQWLGSRLSALGPGAGLDKQLNFAWSELQGPESGALSKLLASTDVRGATSAFAGFERAEGWSAGNPEGIALFSKRLAGAEDALSKFGGITDHATSTIGSAASALGGVDGAANDATKGLGALGSALNQIPGSSSGGGLGGILGSFGSILFGPGANPALNTFPAAPIGGGATLGGLFDSGGYTGPGGVKQPAGIVHRGEIVWSQDDIRRAGGVHVVEGMRLGYRGYADGGIVRPRMRYDAWNDNSRHSGSGYDPTAMDQGGRSGKVVNLTNNFIIPGSPAAPASQNQIAAKTVRSVEKANRTA